jgi:hypothetical protein
MACRYAAGKNDQSRYFRGLGSQDAGLVGGAAWLYLAGPVACRLLAVADQDWRDTAERWLKDTGRIAAGNRTVWRSLGGLWGC